MASPIVLRRSARIAAKGVTPVEPVVVPSGWPTIDQARSRMEECGIKSYSDMKTYAKKTLGKLGPYTGGYEKRMLLLVCTESMLKYRSALLSKDWGLVDVLLDKLIEGNYPDREYIKQWQAAHDHLYPDMMKLLFDHDRCMPGTTVLEPAWDRVIASKYAM